MKLFKRRLIVRLALMAALAGVTGAAAAEKRDAMFIHISHGADHPHRVLMALSMASMMSEDHPVLVYFDIKGIEVVLQGAKNITFAHFPSSQDQLSTLLKKGVAIMACPGCLKAAGIQVANKKQFLAFTEGRIITLDY